MYWESAETFLSFFSALQGLNYRSQLLNLNMLSLESRRLRYRLIFLYKMLNGDSKLDPNDYFLSSLRSTHRFPSDKLLVPLSKHLYRSYFFTVDVVRHWNNMLLSERNVKGVLCFKNSVSLYFKRRDIWWWGDFLCSWCVEFMYYVFSYFPLQCLPSDGLDICCLVKLYCIWVTSVYVVSGKYIIITCILRTEFKVNNKWEKISSIFF